MKLLDISVHDIVLVQPQKSLKYIVHDQYRLLFGDRLVLHSVPICDIVPQIRVLLTELHHDVHVVLGLVG